MLHPMGFSIKKPEKTIINHPLFPKQLQPPQRRTPAPPLRPPPPARSFRRAADGHRTAPQRREAAAARPFARPGGTRGKQKKGHWFWEPQIFWKKVERKVENSERYVLETSGNHQHSPEKDVFFWIRQSGIVCSKTIKRLTEIRISS